MASFTESLGLVLTADTSQWDAAFAKAQAGAASLGGQTAGAAASFDKLGNALEGNLLQGTKALGKLTQEVKGTSGAWSKFSSKWTSDLANLGLKIGGLAAIWNVVGNAVKGAFERSKIDPALAGIATLRKATEDWTAAWERTTDRILEKIARHVTVFDETSTRTGSIEASAWTSAAMRYKEVHGRWVDKQPALGGPQFETASQDTPDFQRYLAEARVTATQSYNRAWDARLARQAETSANTRWWFDTAGEIARRVGFRGASGLATTALAEFETDPFRMGTVTDVMWRAQGGDRNATMADIFGLNKKRGPRRAPRSSWSDVLGPAASNRASWGTLGGPIGTDFSGLSSGGTGTGYFAGYDSANQNTPLGGERMKNWAAELQDQSTIAGAALASMTEGLTAAVDAAITGNEGIGRAFLKGAGLVLRSIALKATGMAAFEGAMALVNPAAAGVHLAAAGKMLAVAALTGGLAAAAGAAAGSGSGGSSAGSAATPAGGGFGARPQNRNEQQPTNIVINIHGFVGTDKNQAIAAIKQGLTEAEAARRIRSDKSRITSYGEAA